MNEHAIAPIRKERSTAGPACSDAAIPVTVKSPVPTIPPTPKKIRLGMPITRAKPFSCWLFSMDFFLNSDFLLDRSIE